MKIIYCNQRNGGYRKALCPEALQVPAWYQSRTSNCKERKVGWEGEHSNNWSLSLHST